MSTEQLQLPRTEEWRVGDQILANMEMEELRSAYLKALRTEMRELWERRNRDPAVEEPTVTPDDARKLFEGWNPPPPDRLSRNFLACIWRTDNWEHVGFTRSNTPNSHGNRLNTYRYVGGH